jgi:hypothetical protein
MCALRATYYPFDPLCRPIDKENVRKSLGAAILTLLLLVSIYKYVFLYRVLLSSGM